MKHLVAFAILINSCRIILSLDRDFFPSVVIPSEISIAVDESIFIRIKNPIEGQTSCSFQAPGRKEINLADSFVQLSDDKCGIRINKVQKSHEGIWKLISTFKNSTFENSVKGTSVVNVKERIVVPKDRKDRIFASTENFAPTGFNLSYCHVSKDAGFAKLSEIDKMNCMIPQDLDDDFREGAWLVKIGVQGESQEISYSVNIHSTGKISEQVISRDLVSWTISLQLSR